MRVRCPRESMGILTDSCPAEVHCRKDNGHRQVSCCLCRLHNFFINQRLSKKDVPDSEPTATGTNVPEPTATDTNVPEPTATDTLNMTLNGAVGMSQREGTGDQQVPDALLDVGHHYDDDPNQDFRRRINNSDNSGKALPREQM